MAAKAVYAESNCLTFKEIAARHAQSKGYFTKRHNFIAFYHFPF
jgi:hypothetical protein